MLNVGNGGLGILDFGFWILDFGLLGIGNGEWGMGNWIRHPSFVIRHLSLGFAPHPLTSSPLHLPCPSAPLPHKLTPVTPDANNCNL